MFYSTVTTLTQFYGLDDDIAFEDLKKSLMNLPDPWVS